MSKRQKFFMCGDCENIVGLIRDNQNDNRCKCIDAMTELVPNDGDSNCVTVSQNGNRIEVSIAVPHSDNDSSVKWVYLMTKEGGQRKRLSNEENSKVSFMLTENDCPLSVYAYCGVHGFWRKEL